MKFFYLFCFLIFSACVNKTEVAKEKDFFETLLTEAKNLSNSPYKERISPLPKELQNLSYEQYNLFRYNIENDLWAKEALPYRISFFPLGTALYSFPVKIYEINYDNSISEVPFSPGFFQYEQQVDFIKKEMPKDAGYAGFKIRHKVQGKDYPDEFAVFLGNSYFRIICEGSSYGLSNRGIAINTGLEGVSEEFPAFEKFYLQKPLKSDTSITIYALLNGKSLTGAYSMKITPGEETTVEVKSIIFMRNEVKVLCLAPITSMFWFTLGQPHNFHDYRPSVHNSQGLIIQNENSCLYEPLTNYPLHKMINDDIKCDSMRYFGFIQRNRNYNRYMDPGVRYHLNPNCVIFPKNKWPKGKLRLFVLPTLTEWMDNINLFWFPEEIPQGDKSIFMEYNIVYSLKEPETNLAYVKYTNLGQDLVNPENTIFALSFEDCKNLIAESKNVKIDLQLPNDVEIVSPPSIEKIEFNNTWRVLFTLSPKKKLAYDDKPFIIRCTLMSSGKAISEEWYFLWFPE